MKLSVQYAAATDKGLVRSGNEDSYIVVDSPQGDTVLAVADGMGGHKGGEFASSAMVEIVEKHFSKKNLNETTWGGHENDSPDYFTKEYLCQITQKGNTKIYHLALEDLEKQGMGTTLTMAIIRNNQMLVAQIGDSRAYLIRKNKLFPLTKDHSVVQREVDMGILTPAEALRDPRKNIITKALGILPEIEPDIYTYQLKLKDRIMLCSDGLYDLVSEKEIHECCRNPSLENGVNDMITMAKEYGGKDNITVILAEIIPSSNLSESRETKK